MGTRITGNGAERVYEAADLWVDRALRADDSLFLPGKPIWSEVHLRELHDRFLNHPDESSASFLEKLQGQLRGSPPDIYQLMGEALYFYFLIVRTQDSANEQRVINRVLNWSPSPVAIPSDLIVGLTPGIVRPGQSFHTGRPFQVGFLIEFVEQWKRVAGPVQKDLLEDPWEFKEFLMNIELKGRLFVNRENAPRMQREAVLHLVFPDTFEAIVSMDHKAQIARTYAKGVITPGDDVDRKLEQIRPELEAQFGKIDYLFYRSEIRQQWDSRHQPDLWNEFVRRAREYVDSGRMESEEIEYKVEIARKLAQARQAVRSSDDGWGDLVKRGIAGNLIHPIEQSKFRHWIDSFPDAALDALQTIWERDAYSVADRVRDFCDLFPRSVSSGAGTRMTVASVLLMGLDAEQYPPFRVTPFHEAYGLTGYGQPDDGADEAALYGHALDFLDRFIREASQRELPLRHRLDAQSVVWAIRDADPAIAESKTQPEHPPPSADPWSSSSIEKLAASLLWETEDLQKIVNGLKDKRQAIFQGPPGTGKTFVAKRIAEWSRDHGGGHEIVQFHPSYTYEDFVEGYRPTISEGGQATFTLTKGPLRRIAERAEANRDATFILVIDEINRGNVAKVLGELYFLLEYRDEKVRLQYRDERFSLPENLWFIGTMNTTDRSIGLLDAALRRRFYFFGFFPDKPPVEGLLSRWLSENNPEAEWVANLVELANRKLEDRHLGIGPSHFMKNDPPLDEGRVRFVWEQAVIPYIEEQCFGDEAKLSKFSYEELKGELDRAASQQVTADSKPDREMGEGDGQIRDGVDDAPD